MSGEWIDAYNRWVNVRYKDAGSQPADVGISGSGPTENVENGCSSSHGWYCYGSCHVDAVKNTGTTCRVCGNERCSTSQREAK
jgi:hypothetical protein